MARREGWCRALLVGLLSAAAISAQTLGNQSLNGKYYFRHLSLGTDGVNPASLRDARTLMGSITFDGRGGYTYIGQLLTGTKAAVSQTGSGGYLVDGGGSPTPETPP